MAKNEEHLGTESRLFDGWAFLVGTPNGTQRLCDHDSPPAVWARIEQAKKEKGFVTFSGARSEAQGKLDGWGVVSAEGISSFVADGPSGQGIGQIAARFAAVEQGMAALHARVSEVEEEFGDVVDGLIEKGVIDAEPEDGAGTVTVMPTAAPAAAVAAHDVEDE